MLSLVLRSGNPITEEIMSRRNNKIDVFITYHPDDHDWVKKKLIPALGKEKISLLVRDEFALGAPEDEQYEKAVVESSKTILVMTSATLENRWVNYVLQLILAMDPDAQQKKLIILALDDCVLPLYLRRLVHLDLSKNSPEIEFRTLITKLAKTLRTAISTYHDSNPEIRLLEILYNYCSTSGNEMIPLSQIKSIVDNSENKIPTVPKFLRILRSLNYIEGDDGSDSIRLTKKGRRFIRGRQVEECMSSEHLGQMWQFAKVWFPSS
jgi:hypothetical protein